jgi:hypothetical protein
MAGGAGAARGGKGSLVLWAVLAALMLASTLVWSAGQVAGLIAHGSWPHVSVLWSPVELVQVLTGHEPVKGVPIGLFWLCLLLEAGSGVLLAVSVRHRLRGGHRHVWVPRPPEGIAKPRSFRDGYRRLVRADVAQAATANARRAEPALVAGVGLAHQELAGSLSVEQAARLLAEHFTREQLGALIGELAERRMAGEASR